MSYQAEGFCNVSKVIGDKSVPVSARQMREDAVTNNPLSRIRSSNNPPRNDEENEKAKAIVEKWTADLSAQIASLHQQQQVRGTEEEKRE
jgi:hypothetical protein